MNHCSFCCSAHNILQTECGHVICRDCFNNYIKTIKRYRAPCFHCFSLLSDNECEKNLYEEELKSYNATKSFYLCINDPNKYQCFNPDCSGLYTHDGLGELSKFVCKVCQNVTCIKCHGVHLNEETCEEWKIRNSDLIKSRQKMIKENKRQIKSGLSMECVKCKTMIQRLEGCDGVLCPVCFTGLCFRTKKARWGPKGEGDFTGGCRCMWDGKTLCHPRCLGRCAVHLPSQVIHNINPLLSFLFWNETLQENIDLTNNI